MNTHSDPVTGKVLSVFFSNAIPSVVGMLALSCAVVVDGFFLGNFAGAESLAAVNLTVPVSGLMFGLGLMLSVGGAIRCGKHLGAANHTAANISFSQTIVFISVISIVLTIFGLFFLDQIVVLLGADATLAPAVAEYLKIMLLFTLFHLGNIGLAYFLRVANKPLMASAILITGSLINVALDWLFIVKLHMGHQGAAIGTGLAAMITFVMLSIPFLTRQLHLTFIWHRRDIVEVPRAAFKGSPEFFDEFSFGLTVFIFNWLIMKQLGAHGLAAFSIINYMILTSLIFSYGISESLQPIISRNYGAFKHKRISQLLALSAVSVFAVGTVISVLLLLVPQAVASFFIQAGEKETIQLTKLFISRIWPLFILNGVNVVLITYLTAMHKSLDSSLVVLTRNLLLPVFFLIVTQVIMGSDAILIVLPLSELTTFLIALYLLYKNSPKALVGLASTAR